MRILRFLGKAVLAFGLLALVVWFVMEQITRWQTMKRLEEQADAIVAHREAQRAASGQAAAATPLAAPPVTPSDAPAATSATADAASAPVGTAHAFR